jgi:hypothetical protein
MSVLTKVGLNSAAQRPAVIRIKHPNLDLPEDVGFDQGRVGLNSAEQRPAVIGIKRPNLDLPEDVSLDWGWLNLG